MSAAEWEIQWHRLDTFNLRSEADRTKVSAEWFAQLRHFHVDAVDHGIGQLIGAAKDSFLPPLGILRGLIQTRIDRYERAAGKCATCHGATWIDAAPFKSNGMIYENVVVRCPDCGIPAPQYSAPNGRQELTSREYAEWKIGDAPKQYMPPGLEAKPSREGEVSEMKAAMERLRHKLFGDR